MRRSSGAVAAFTFTLATLAYIWLIRPTFPGAIWLLVAWIAAAFLLRQETIASLGLSPRVAFEASWAWRYSLAVTVAIAAFTASGFVWRRTLAYAAWAVIQQLVYQNMVYKPLRNDWGMGWRTRCAAAGLFAAAHLPNPVLTPATFAWGAASSRLFDRRPSVWALAALHVALSAALFSLTPQEWKRSFRVGPGFWQAAPAGVRIEPPPS